MHSFNLEYFKKKLLINQSAEIRIISDSMSPLILPGQTLKVTPLTGKLKRFDVILFSYHGEPFCHFFWGEVANKDTVCTKSLKNPNSIDIPVHYTSLIGRVTCKKITLLQKINVYFKIIWTKNY